MKSLVMTAIVFCIFFASEAFAVPPPPSRPKENQRVIADKDSDVSTAAAYGPNLTFREQLSDRLVGTTEERKR
jgi:hypothetical protein